MHKSGARRKAEDPRASFDRRVTAYATEHHATYLPSTRLRPNTQLRYCGDGNKKESLDQEMEQDYKRCFRLAIGESPDCHSVTGRDLRERLVGDPICNYPWQRSGNPSSFFLSSVSFFFFFWFCLHLPTGGPIGCVDSQRVGYGTESTDFSFLELLAVPRLTTQHVQFMDAW